MNIYTHCGVMVLDVGCEFRDQSSNPSKCQILRDVGLEQQKSWWPPPRLATH